MTRSTRQVPEVTLPSPAELDLGSDHTELENGVGSKDVKDPVQWDVPSLMIS